MSIFKTIRYVFNKKFTEIEVNDEMVITIEINPNIKHFFKNKNIFKNDFDPLMRRFTNNEEEFIGMLWGADVKIVKNLNCIAKFIGENGAVTILNNFQKQYFKRIKLQDSRFKYLEV